jgi:lipoprotein-releasing system permease protein
MPPAPFAERRLNDTGMLAMYKLLLCWRYLLKRRLALACVVSITLGVATLIVVNSVMSGFSTKLKDRLHGMLADLSIEGRYFDGFPNPEARMERIRQSPVGDKIEAMAATMEVMAILQIPVRGQMMTKFVKVIGIDPKDRAKLGGFAEHLVQQKNHPEPAFKLNPEAERRHHWRYPPVLPPRPESVAGPDGLPPPAPPDSPVFEVACVIVGRNLAFSRDPRTLPGEPLKEHCHLELGDEIILTTMNGEWRPVIKNFAVCDYLKSEMAEYDSTYVYVPLDVLQQLRTMEGRATNIQIKLKDYADAPVVVKALQEMFHPSAYHVETWEEKQGALLEAINIEKGILNVLLFLIVGVAGFGILAIFSMIVVEKTRDIGILKALGASNSGVMKIFLAYGLLLGLIGAAFGTGLGLLITTNVNEIEGWIAGRTGHQIFNRQVYYFTEIPVHIQPWMVLTVNGGALAIAVVFSILPALRAALLHPVRALRYE